MDLQLILASKFYSFIEQRKIKFGIKDVWLKLQHDK